MNHVIEATNKNIAARLTEIRIPRPRDIVTSGVLCPQSLIDKMAENLTAFCAGKLLIVWDEPDGSLRIEVR